MKSSTVKQVPWRDDQRIVGGDHVHLVTQQLVVPPTAQLMLAEFLHAHQVFVGAVQRVENQKASTRASDVTVETKHRAFGRAVRVVSDELRDPETGARDDARHLQVLGSNGRVGRYTNSPKLKVALEAAHVVTRAKAVGVSEGVTSALEKAGSELVDALRARDDEALKQSALKTELAAARADWNAAFSRFRAILRVELGWTESARYFLTFSSTAQTSVALSTSVPLADESGTPVAGTGSVEPMTTPSTSQPASAVDGAPEELAGGAITAR